MGLRARISEHLFVNPLWHIFQTEAVLITIKNDVLDNRFFHANFLLSSRDRLFRARIVLGISSRFKDRLNALGCFHVSPEKQSKPANADFLLDLLEFLVSGDEVGFAVLRECRGKAIRVRHPVARLECSRNPREGPIGID